MTEKRQFAERPIEGAPSRASCCIDRESVHKGVCGVRADWLFTIEAVREMVCVLLKSTMSYMENCYHDPYHQSAHLTFIQRHPCWVEMLRSPQATASEYLMHFIIHAVSLSAVQW